MMQLSNHEVVIVRSAVVSLAGSPMRKLRNASFFLLLAQQLLMMFAAVSVQAQTIDKLKTTIELKNGESAEVGEVFFIGSKCRSRLTSTPEAEILDGPHGVTVSVKPAMLIPRGLKCAKAIAGGKMVVSANAVQNYGQSSMVIRVIYKTKNGARQLSQRYNVTLLP
jgi:hypothetical protein